MRYARLCIHDQLNPHDFGQHTPESGRCPGGEFLPEDALVIEKENGKWPDWCYRGASKQFLEALVLSSRLGKRESNE